MNKLSRAAARASSADAADDRSRPDVGRGPAGRGRRRFGPAEARLRACDGLVARRAPYLAFIRAGVIEPRKSACDDAIERYEGACGPFEAIDRWGQPVRVVLRLEMGKDFFKLLEGSRGAGLFVRDQRRALVADFGGRDAYEKQAVPLRWRRSTASARSST